MTTTGTSTTSRSYEAATASSEAVKSNGTIFDHEEWETNENMVDSGSLLRKPKQIQPTNFANYQMVRIHKIQQISNKTSTFSSNIFAKYLNSFSLLFLMKMNRSFTTKDMYVCKKLMLLWIIFQLRLYILHTNVFFIFCSVRNDVFQSCFKRFEINEYCKRKAWVGTQNQRIFCVIALEKCVQMGC